jgi:hypothetical protein
MLMRVLNQFEGSVAFGVYALRRNAFIVLDNIESILALVAMAAVSASKTTFGMITAMLSCVPLREPLVLSPDSNPSRNLEK